MRRTWTTTFRVLITPHTRNDHAARTHTREWRPRSPNCPYTRSTLGRASPTPYTCAPMSMATSSPEPLITLDHWSRYKLSWASCALSLSYSLISHQRWRRRRWRSLHGTTKSRARIADATKGRSVAGARGAPDADSAGLQYMEPAVHAKQRSESSENEIRCERRVHEGVNACSLSRAE